MIERFDELWSDYLEGELDRDGLSELNQLLSENPELLRLASDLYEEHRILGALIGRFDSEGFLSDVHQSVQMDEEAFVHRVSTAVDQLPRSAESSLNSRWQFGWVGYLIAIACTLLLSLGIQYLFITTDPGLPDADTPRDGVANLIASDSAVWAKPVQKNDKVELLPQTLSLISGTAVVRFDCGALAMMEGKCDLVIESGSFVRLARGQVTIHAPEEAFGFTVVTPSSEIIDLGTEFHLNVAENGETAVQVLEGEIQAEPRKANNTQTEILSAGQAVLFRPNGKRSPLVGHTQAKRFRQRYSELKSHAQGLSASEPFDYAPGKRVLHDLNRGKGWVGSWRDRQGEEKRHFLNDEGKMLFIEKNRNVFKSFAMRENQRASVVHFPSGAFVRLRKMKKAIDLSRNGQYYISFLLRQEKKRNIEGEHSFHPSMFRLTLRSSTDYWGDTVGLSMPSGKRPILQLGPKNRYSSPARFMRPVPLLCVMKIRASKKGNDVAFVRIYEPDEKVHFVEPTLWTMRSETFRSESTLDLIVLTAHGKKQQWLDELRIGRSWESVTAGYGDHHQAMKGDNIE